MKNVTITLLFITQTFFVKSQSVLDSVRRLNSNEFRSHIAIRELIDSFAYYADRTKAQRQAALFVENGTMEIYRSEPDTSKPIFVLKGRKELENAFKGLEKYNMTFHLTGRIRSNSGMIQPGLFNALPIISFLKMEKGFY